MLSQLLTQAFTVLPSPSPLFPHTSFVPSHRDDSGTVLGFLQGKTACWFQIYFKCKVCLALAPRYTARIHNESLCPTRPHIRHLLYLYISCVCVWWGAGHAQSCLILYDPMDFSPLGSSVHIFKARILDMGCHFLLQGYISYFHSKDSGQPATDSILGTLYCQIHNATSTSFLFLGRPHSYCKTMVLMLEKESGNLLQASCYSTGLWAPPSGFLIWWV